MGMTTTTQLTTNITGAYDRRLLDQLGKDFIYVGLGEDRNVPMRSGATITLRRYDDLDASDVSSLTEGVTPDATSMGKTDLTITCAQYGRYVQLSDWLELTGLDAAAIRPLDMLAKQSRNIHDQLARNGINAGTQVAYSAASAARTAVDDKIKDAMLNWAVNLLRRKGVSFIEKKINAGPNVGTLPIDPGYVFIGHTDLDADIRALAGFIPVRSYANPGMAQPGEIGSVGYVRFVLTNNAKVYESDATMTDIGTTGMRSTDGANVNVYLSILLGEKFFANSKIGGESMKSYVKNFASGGTNDPLEQRSTVGWKSTYGVGITDDRRGVRFETCASALATTQSSAGVGAGSGDTTYKSFLT